MNRRELLGLMGIVGLESAPRYRELLYKLISEDLEFPPPGFTIESDRPEWSFLKDELRWQTQSATTGAVAAQNAFCQIFNPGGSGRLVTVLGFVASKTVAGRVNTALTTTVRGATGAAFAVAADTRWNTPITPLIALTARDAITVSFGSAAPFGTDIPLITYQVGATIAPTQVLFGIPIHLAPGTGVVLSNATVNEALEAAWFGFSRQARPEELTP